MSTPNVKNQMGLLNRKGFLESRSLLCVYTLHTYNICWRSNFVLCTIKREKKIVFNFRQPFTIHSLVKQEQSKIQQTKMLVTCQRFCDLFLFGLVWQYSTNQNQYNKGRFKVMNSYLQQWYNFEPTFIHCFCFLERAILVCCIFVYNCSKIRINWICCATFHSWEGSFWTIL